MNIIQYNLLLPNNTQINIFIERKKIKNHYIKIFPNLKVVVCIPLNMELNLIYSFIEKNKKWIQKNLDKYKNIQKENIKDNLSNGGTVKILDNQYIVYIYESNKNSIVIDGFNIYIYSIRSNDINYITKQYNNYLKEKSAEYFKESIKKFWPIFQKYNLTFPNLKVKAMKSKWGSCRPSSSQITLNLYLYKTSVQCIDYVVLHELTHLVHHGHKQRFYNFLEKYMPNYETIEKQLNVYATQILY
jgi:hypothetical protein